MKKIRIFFIFLILYVPLTPYFFRSFSFTFPIQVLSNREKLERDLSLKEFSYVFDFFNSLKGNSLSIIIGDLLNYTDLKLLNIYDEEFLNKYFLKNDLKNIKYIFLNHYNDPVMYTPLLESTLYDPKKSQLIFDFFMWKVFKIETNKEHSPNSKFTLQVSCLQKDNRNFIRSYITHPDFHTYASHKSEFPHVTIMPKVEYGDFPLLEPGIYDFICSMNVEVNNDTLIEFSVHPYSSGQHIFYLKKGKNLLKTRFLHSHQPFRLVFCSKNPNIIFHDVNLSYNFQEKILSPDNMIMYEKFNIPVAVDSNGNANLKVNLSETLIFEKPFSKGDALSFKAKGYGTLTVVVSNYSKFMSNLLHWKLGQWFFSTLLSPLRMIPNQVHEYSLSRENKDIYIPFKEDSQVLILIESGTPSKKQNFNLSSLSIERKN